MNEKAINTWLDIAPEYMDFLLKYFRINGDIFKGIKTSHKVSSDLTNVLLAGLVISYAIIWISSSSLLKEQGTVARFLLNLNLDLWFTPLIIIFVIFIIAILFHISAKVGRLLFRESELVLSGSIEDTVNASLATSAVFIPIFIMLVVVMAWLQVDEMLIVSIPLTIIIGVAFLFGYFPWSLSKTHGIPYLQALGAVFVASATVGVVFGFAY